MKKLILILMLIFGSLFSQEIITNEYYNIDTKLILIANDNDTLNLYLTYNTKTKDFYLTFYLNNDLEFTDNFSIGLFNFENGESFPASIFKKDKMINYYFNYQYFYKFADKLESIEFNTKTENVKYYIIEKDKRFLLRLTNLIGYKR